jgi:hypothetical protein
MEIEFLTTAGIGKRQEYYYPYNWPKRFNQLIINTKSGILIVQRA